MPEHPEAPDQITAWRIPDHDGIPMHKWVEGRVPRSPQDDMHAFYLRSTPSRLAADQMLETMRGYRNWLMIGLGATDGERVQITRADLQKMAEDVRAAIAAAQGEET